MLLEVDDLRKYFPLAAIFLLGHWRAIQGRIGLTRLSGRDMLACRIHRLVWETPDMAFKETGETNR